MKEIKIYNSLTNKVEVFKPIIPGKVSIYVCGPTVYDDAHLGNFRPTVFFDVFRRFLMKIGYDVTYVSNFTDVDDKIIKRAIELGISEKELTDKTIQDYLAVCNDFNVLKADYNPRVSQTMPEIVSFINELVETKHAYISGNDVYFRVDSVPNYGRLANIKLDELQAGARIATNDQKENPFDFTLWKKTNVGVTWESPWGNGRPGWHTECVVMINKYLGHTIDIHGGGFDLKFPHHENELAQNVACYHADLANYWMHNGFLNINNEKMSKSLGNVITGKEAIEKFGGVLARYMLISTYYRSPINLNDEYLETCKNELDKIKKTTNDLAKRLQILDIFENKGTPDIEKFLDALSDDVNIANAKTELFELLKQININLRNIKIEKQILLNNYASLLEMLSVLGLKFDIINLTKEDLALISDYNNAKANKDFDKSDKLRSILIEKNLF